jgi:hypothetical protein
MSYERWILSRPSFVAATPLHPLSSKGGKKGLPSRKGSAFVVSASPHLTDGINIRQTARLRSAAKHGFMAGKVTDGEPLDPSWLHVLAFAHLDWTSSCPFLLFEATSE